MPSLAGRRVHGDDGAVHRRQDRDGPLLVAHLEGRLALRDELAERGELDARGADELVGEVVDAHRDEAVVLEPGPGVPGVQVDAGGQLEPAGGGARGARTAARAAARGSATRTATSFALPPCT